MKRTKPLLLLFSLMLCMGVFLCPITAYAQSDTTPPEISAKLSGELLHIEASDADSGVEAVYIGGTRVNYRVDSSLDVIFKDYAGTGEYTQVYAIDFAGNKSKTVQIKNPYYTPQSSKPSASSTTSPAETPAPVETTAPEPAEPREPKPFTPDGTGTVQDNATDGDGKEFFTIVTPDENVFYLIIDRQRNNDNVYLLNTVTEEDLAALADKSGKSGSQSGVVTPEPTPQPAPTPTPELEPEPQPEPAKTNTGTIVFILIAVAAAGGAGYYFKIVKPKQQSQEPDEFDDGYDDADDDGDEDYYFPDDEELSTDPIPEDPEDEE